MGNYELRGTRGLDGSEGRQGALAANEGQMESGFRVPRRRDTSEFFDQQTVFLANYRAVLGIYTALKILAERVDTGECSLAEAERELPTLVGKFRDIWPLHESVVRHPDNASAPSADLFKEFRQLLEPKKRKKIDGHIARFLAYIKETERKIRLEEDRLDGIQRIGEAFNGPADGNVTERVDGPAEVENGSHEKSSIQPT